MKRFMAGLLVAVALAHAAEAQTTTNSSARPYPTDYTVIKDLGGDLFEALKTSFRLQVNPRPIWLKDDVRPYVRPAHFQDPSGPMRVVYVSEGFIHLANSVAHAKAIDRIEPGFFDKYTATLSQEAAEGIVPELPQFTDARYWTDDVMNEQMSYFNQIVGCVAAISLAHHYLGHYDKYQAMLKDSAINPITMASSCTLSEWQRALKLGAANALDCGMAFDGLKALLDCVDHMPKRPGWTLYILPYTAKLNVAKIKDDLTEVEKLFFGQR